MARYLVTFEAEIYVEVEADDEMGAEAVAWDAWQRDDVEAIEVIDIDLVSGE